MAPRRAKLFEHFGVTQVFDIGANEGQFGLELRRYGFHGRIVSCEPLSSAFGVLRREARGDPRWTVLQVGIGDRDGEARINIAANSASSSLLPMLPRLSSAAPHASFVGVEAIQVITLPTLLEGYGDSTAGTFVKLDVQGYESRILEAARAVLGNMTGVQLEMSLAQLYESEALFPEMLDFMGREGFVLMGVEPGLSDPVSGRLLQMDGIFFRD
jgi:FkbM family methyltransferase